MRALSFGLIVLLHVALAGCFGPPIRTTVQPALDLRVVNAADDPIDGATAYYYAFANPEGRFRAQRTVETNQRGVAQFEELTKWEGLLLRLIYGAYMQGWCVEADTYEATYGVL